MSSLVTPAKTTAAPDMVVVRPDAQCCLWWSHTPALHGQRVGFIGKFQAGNQHAAVPLLDDACDKLAAAGVTCAIGPVDGSTWHSYRLVTWSSGEPQFFLEPANPEEYPAYFAAAGFETLARYYSSITSDLADDDEYIASIEEKLSARGVKVRALKISDFESELAKVFAVCEKAFTGNFLYTPTSENAFIEQYASIKTLIDPRLVFLAEKDEEVVGFVFALPNLTDKDGQTIIVKTLARLPERQFAGLGHLLLSKVQRQASDLGYRQAIHALMHQSNGSVALSNRYARIFRHYELFSRKL